LALTRKLSIQIIFFTTIFEREVLLVELMIQNKKELAEFLKAGENLVGNLLSRELQSIYSLTV